MILGRKIFNLMPGSNGIPLKMKESTNKYCKNIKKRKFLREKNKLVQIIFERKILRAVLTCYLLKISFFTKMS
jgi:hypothetical protein